MKQHITSEQLQELSNSQKISLRRWVLARFPESRGELMTWINVKPPLPLLSIGQMIEFLGDDYIKAICWLDGSDNAKASEVCDFLWNAVKDMLEGVAMINRYHEPPSTEVFIDLKNSAIRLWNRKSTNTSYIDEVEQLANVSENFMRMVQMFDLNNQRELAQMLKEDTKHEIFTRLEAIGDANSYMFMPHKK